MDDALSFTLAKLTRASGPHGLLLAALALPACAMIGFDPVPEAQLPVAGARAPGLIPVAGAGAAGTAAPVFVPMENPMQPTLPMNALPSNDAGDVALGDASAMNGDGAITSDAGECMENACGGCDELSEAPGTRCGACGAGYYACAGSDELVCEDADAFPVAEGSDGLIDDFEDGDGSIAALEQRSGAWYTTSDGSGGLIVPSPLQDFTLGTHGFDGSAHAAHVFGGGFSEWGATLAVPLNESACPYDASAYRGIRFRARGQGLPRFSVATVHTVPIGFGGRCFDSCFDHFTIGVQLSEEWVRYDVDFVLLSQLGWGTPAFFDRSELLYLEFFFDVDTGFDLVVDDIEFY